jgi:hypothetical protein
MLRYKRLSTNIFTVTLEAGTLSRRQNKSAQVFAVLPNGIKVYPMRTKGEAHHCLNTHFHEVGDPEKMIMDGSKFKGTHSWGNSERREGNFIGFHTPVCPLYVHLFYVHHEIP